MNRLLVFTGILLLAAGCLFGQDVVATTSVISSVVREIGRDKIEVATLVSPGSCPGHFDLKVGQLSLIEKTGVLFAHGFEGYLGKISRAVSIPGFTPFIVEVEGNWLLPQSQREAYAKVAKMLSSRFPAHAGFFEENRKESEENIDLTEKRIKEILSRKNFSGAAVICNGHIKEILEYMGFEVAATYGRKEEMSPHVIKDLINLGRRKNVGLVVDNLQAGPDTGAVISSELNIPHLAISNFPGVFPGTPTLRQTLYENVKRINAAYE